MEHLLQGGPLPRTLGSQPGLAVQDSVTKQATTDRLADLAACEPACTGGGGHLGTHATSRAGLVRGAGRVAGQKVPRRTRGEADQSLPSSRLETHVEAPVRVLLREVRSACLGGGPQTSSNGLRQLLTA